MRHSLFPVYDLDGTRVYFSGDTEDIPEMRALTDIDLACVCMILPFTMTPAQAAFAVPEFRPRVVYPCRVTAYGDSAGSAATTNGVPNVSDSVSVSVPGRGHG